VVASLLHTAHAGDREQLNTGKEKFKAATATYQA